VNLPVWLYWEGEKPGWISCCEETVRAHAQNVHHLSSADFENLRCSDRDIDLSRLCVAHRADFVRSFLLYRYGGLWIDADCLVMRDLEFVLGKLERCEFIGFRERQGHVANNFMAARPNSAITAEYYRCVCDILRSGQTLAWTTIGSTALTPVLSKLTIPWLQLGYDLIQPICWSQPGEFFVIRPDAEHAACFNERSICYMLSNNTAQGYAAAHPSRSLLDEGTFFRWLYNRALRPVEVSRHVRLPLTPQSWFHIPFCVDAIRHISPSRVLDVGVGYGRWGMLVRDVCDEAEDRSYRENWQVHLEGIANSVTDVEEYHHHFYNWIHVGNPEVLLEAMTRGWDLLFIGQTEGLDRALDISSYVILTTMHPEAGWDGPDPIFPACLIRELRFTEAGVKYAVFLLSRLDPRQLRST